jgi:hypothetical protein
MDEKKELLKFSGIVDGIYWKNKAGVPYTHQLKSGGTAPFARVCLDTGSEKVYFSAFDINAIKGFEKGDVVDVEAQPSKGDFPPTLKSMFKSVEMETPKAVVEKQADLNSLPVCTNTEYVKKKLIEMKEQLDKLINVL